VTVTVVHLGDSITAGQLVDPAVRWTTLIESDLRLRFGAEVESSNVGISGEQTRMALERFPAAVQEARPNVLTIQYGLNDCNCWQTDAGLPRVSEQAFAANVAEMVRRARAHGTSQIVLATNHPTLRLDTMVSGEVYEDANARYSELMRHVAEETGVILCDIRAAFERSQADPARLLVPAPDLLHLSAEGHRLYADTIWPFVEQSVQAVRGQSLVQHT
jgi:lysophospholipase L1-like esterase